MNNKMAKGQEWALIKRVTVLYRPYLLLLILGIVATLLMSSMDSAFAYSLKYFIDKGIVHPDNQFIKWIPLGIIALALIRAGSSMGSRYCMTRLTNSVVMDLRRNVFDKLLTMPAKYYDHTSTGTLLAAFLYNTDQVVQAGLDVFVSGLQDGTATLGLLVVLFATSWKLALIILTCGPPITLVARWASRRMRGISKKVQNLMGDVTRCAEENIKNYKMIRIYGGEQYETERAHQALKKTFNRQLKIVITNSLSVGVVPFLVCLPMAAIFYLFRGAVLSVSVGSFVSFVTALVMIIKPLRRVVGFNSQVQTGLAGADAIFELLDSENEHDQGTRPLARANGAIEFRDVSFSYVGAKRPAIQHISFKAQPGQTIALVGRSGSGKTTITNLLPRFYEAEQGQVLIDGHPLQEYRLKDLRAQFSLVSQNVTLFNDSIAHNIAYGDMANASEAEIVAAAEAAYAMEFIRELPEGIHTLIGENGVLLSGGQRQRIAIARAILRKAPITILDEATSALDTETERHIQKALQNLTGQSTSIVIAHRLSTVEHADWILVMQEGYLVEQGTHQQLLEKDGVYTRLYGMQFSELV